MSLLTFLVSVIADDDLETSLDTARLEFQRYRARIQRHMVALYPKYCISDRLKKQLQTLDTQQDDKSNVRAELMQAYLEVATNVTSYCRALLSNLGMVSCFPE